MPQGEIRSFIAIELPDAIKCALARIIGDLKRPQYSFLRWVNPFGIHLTLKFLGNIKIEVKEAIVEVLKEHCSRTQKIILEIANLGMFPNSKRPHVLCIGMGGEVDKLIVLQGQIDNSLERLGFSKEKRSFSPHITLARFNGAIERSELSALMEVVQQYSNEMKYEIIVGTVSLMRSQLFPTGSIYSQLAEVGLGE